MKRSLKSSIKSLNILGILLAFLVLCVIMAIASPAFLKQTNLLKILQQISINFTIAIGMTFVILIGGIDLSVGAGETHVLMGPNGTGKSTLGCAITGSPASRQSGCNTAWYASMKRLELLYILDAAILGSSICIHFRFRYFNIEQLDIIQSKFKKSTNIL